MSVDSTDVKISIYKKGISGKRVVRVESGTLNEIKDTPKSKEYTKDEIESLTIGDITPQNSGLEVDDFLLVRFLYDQFYYNNLKEDPNAEIPGSDATILSNDELNDAKVKEYLDPDKIEYKTKQLEKLGWEYERPFSGGNNIKYFGNGPTIKVAFNDENPIPERLYDSGISVTDRLRTGAYTKLHATMKEQGISIKESEDYLVLYKFGDTIIDNLGTQDTSDDVKYREVQARLFLITELKNTTKPTGSNGFGLATLGISEGQYISNDPDKYITQKAIVGVGYSTPKYTEPESKTLKDLGVVAWAETQESADTYLKKYLVGKKISTDDGFIAGRVLQGISNGSMKSGVELRFIKFVKVEELKATTDAQVKAKKEAEDKAAADKAAADKKRLEEGQKRIDEAKAKNIENGDALWVVQFNHIFVYKGDYLSVTKLDKVYTQSYISHLGYMLKDGLITDDVIKPSLIDVGFNTSSQTQDGANGPTRYYIIDPATGLATPSESVESVSSESPDAEKLRLYSENIKPYWEIVEDSWSESYKIILKDYGNCTYHLNNGSSIVINWHDKELKGNPISGKEYNDNWGREVTPRDEKNGLRSMAVKTFDIIPLRPSDKKQLPGITFDKESKFDYISELGDNRIGYTYVINNEFEFDDVVILDIILKNWKKLYPNDNIVILDADCTKPTEDIPFIDPVEKVYAKKPMDVIGVTPSVSVPTIPMFVDIDPTIKCYARMSMLPFYVLIGDTGLIDDDITGYDMLSDEYVEDDYDAPTLDTLLGVIKGDVDEKDPIKNNSSSNVVNNNSSSNGSWDFIFGDSIAAGIAKGALGLNRKAGGSGDPVSKDDKGASKVGANPVTVLSYLKDASFVGGTSDLSNKIVILSTGYSNGSGTNASKDTIKEQFKFLKNKNCTVYVVGISNTPPTNLVGGNDWLEAESKNYGFTFLGGFDPAADKIHPPSYLGYWNSVKSKLGTGSSNSNSNSSNSSVSNGKLTDADISILKAFDYATTITLNSDHQAIVAKLKAFTDINDLLTEVKGMSVKTTGLNDKEILAAFSDKERVKTDFDFNKLK
jgi:hypothetical protein